MPACTQRDFGLCGDLSRRLGALGTECCVKEHDGFRTNCRRGIFDREKFAWNIYSHQGLTRPGGSLSGPLDLGKAQTEKKVTIPWVKIAVLQILYTRGNDISARSIARRAKVVGDSKKWLARMDRLFTYLFYACLQTKEFWPLWGPFPQTGCLSAA